MSVAGGDEAWAKYHVLRFDKGHYSYECERGLSASG
jgi:hypothetical protein